MDIWPADTVERRAINRLIRYGENARMHSAEQIAQIARSIQEWGFTVPVLVDEQGVLIAGHARTQAAEQLGLTSVPVMVARGWSAKQIKAYRLADNRLAETATWNGDLLQLEFAALGIEQFDLTLMGWDKDGIASILTERTKGITDPDAVPEPLEQRASEGDVWSLGGHTLYCGDCLDVLPDLHRTDALITDPPFGIGFGYDQHDDTDYGPEGYGAWIWRIIEQAERLCAAGGPLFVWQAPENLRQCVTWFPREWRLYCGARNFVQMGRGTVMQFAYDAVLAWWKPGAEPWTAATGNRDWHVADTASQVSKTKNIQRRHPCPRPVDQVQHIIEQWVRPGSVILEPFSGSGTTIIAAETAGRRCVAIEKSPAYCDIALTRWEQFTGKEAVRHVQ